MGKLTKAQRDVLQFVADRPGAIRDRDRDFRPHRADVVRRCWLTNGWLVPPRCSRDFRWALSEAGRQALADGGKR
jgi:hypothetical protein